MNFLDTNETIRIPKERIVSFVILESADALYD